MGQLESIDTAEAPLVSAEWHPVDVAGDTEKTTIVHGARSDEFVVHLDGGASGRIGVWLVYADFMGAKPPRDWPRAPEYAGGILAYFDVDWALAPGDRCEVSVQMKVPPRATGFDWPRWAKEARQLDGVESTAKLSDRETR